MGITEASRLGVELQQVYAVVLDLIDVGLENIATLEFQDGDDPVAQQEAVDAQAPTPEIILQNNAGEGRKTWVREHGLEHLNFARKLLLKDPNARLPFFVLLRFDVPAIAGCMTGETGHDRTRFGS